MEILGYLVIGVNNEGQAYLIDKEFVPQVFNEPHLSNNYHTWGDACQVIYQIVSDGNFPNWTFGLRKLVSETKIHMEKM